MHKCLLCDKEFKYKSELNKHNNRKVKCNIKPNTNLNCDVCKINFKCNTERIRHEKTNKHIKNLTTYGNYNNIYNGTVNNSNINNITNINNIKNIINLTLNINTFDKTNLKFLRSMLVKDIIENQFIEYLIKSESPYCDVGQLILKFMDGFIEIFEHLHFNISIKENHNCKILLLFPSMETKLYEYLILEVNPDTSELEWHQINYDGFLIEMLKLMQRVSEKIPNDDFDRSIEYIKVNLIDNKEIQNKIKPELEAKLSDMSINFLKKMNMPDRPVCQDEDFYMQMNDYLKWRNQATRLSNGLKPIVVNPRI